VPFGAALPKASRAHLLPSVIERLDRRVASPTTALAMIFKLAQAAEKSWRRLKGYSLLPKVILGVKFNDGIEIVKSQSQTAA
jgi:hypothetical protein